MLDGDGKESELEEREEIMKGFGHRALQIKGRCHTMHLLYHTQMVNLFG